MLTDADLVGAFCGQCNSYTCIHTHSWRSSRPTIMTNKANPLNTLVQDVPTTTALDRQVGGNHYKNMPIQPWQVIDACKLDFYVGTAVAYLMRWEAKGGLQDIEKAIHTLEHFVEQQKAKLAKDKQ